MKHDVYAVKIGEIQGQLYKTAFLYMGSEQDALDAVGEAVLSGFKACGKLRQPEFFTTWMTRILLNTCSTALRKKNREILMDELPEQGVGEYDNLPLKEAVGKLPESLRAVVVLRYFSGLTLEETAAALGLPRGTVTSRQKKALELLRLDLERED